MRERSEKNRGGGGDVEREKGRETGERETKVKRKRRGYIAVGRMQDDH